jgi:small-conductance mechanosensitive channel
MYRKKRQATPKKSIKRTDKRPSIEDLVEGLETLQTKKKNNVAIKERSSKKGNAAQDWDDLEGVAQKIKKLSKKRNSNVSNDTEIDALKKKNKELEQQLEEYKNWSIPFFQEYERVVRRNNELEHYLQMYS